MGLKKRALDEACQERAGAARESCPSGRPHSGFRTAQRSTLGCVLVVDDDPLVLTMTERTLSRHGFQILTASDGGSAVQVFREERHRIDVVVLDMTMPDMDGIETCVALYGEDTSVRVIFSSGYEASVAEAAELPDCVKGFVQKPYRPSEMASLIQRVIEED